MTFHYGGDDIADGDIEGYILSLPVMQRAELLRAHLYAMIDNDEDEAIGWLGLAFSNEEDVQMALIRDIAATLTADWYALGLNIHGGVTECGGLTYEDTGRWERYKEEVDVHAGRFMVYMDGALHDFMVGSP